ncbi:dickkopf-related protein 3a [Periophthalmus magnuspinnatus]|uniref:dickkopf-related protein 3a n=1 Tax=Periophthalmus magnuspinnatus TaxID=409849 RepID=UPI00145C1010|nr:dickkopf-related protein 3a [Periophthalmus magnuspinnatus]
MCAFSLIILLLAAPVRGILPDIVDSGLNHILGDVFSRGQTDLDSHMKENQLQQSPESHQLNDSVTPPPPSIPSSPPNDSTSNNLIKPVQYSAHLDTNITSSDHQPSDLDNNIYHGCITDDDCGKGEYCFSQAQRSKCMSCKALDVPCTRDVECCDDHTCVWGQCTESASKGDAGSTCQTQSDCNPDLCCAFHKALLFPICLSKPIEREQCFSASNHLMELLSRDPQDEGPRKHCPCVGDLHCQHLGRGSMCLKGEDSSEEDMTDNLYSEIDYII